MNFLINFIEILFNPLLALILNRHINVKLLRILYNFFHIN